MRKIIGVALAGLLWLSCGSSSQSTCQQIGTVICQKACACLDGPACQISQGGLSISFNSEADCQGIYVTFGCSMGDQAAYNDATACLPLVQAATCTGTGTDAALAFPTDMACQTPQKN